MKKKNIAKIKPIENNQEVNEFYEKILAKIQTLANSNETQDFSKALMMLDEELAQPYIPYEYFDKFWLLKAEILKQKYNKEIEQYFWQQTPMQLLLSILAETRYFKFEHWEVFLKKIQDEELDIQDFLFNINEIFKSKHFSNFIKMKIFFGLNEMFEELHSWEFDFYNNLTKQTISLAYDLEMLQDFLAFETKTLKLLHKEYFKEISEFRKYETLFYKIQDTFFPLCIFDDEHQALEIMKLATDKDKVLEIANNEDDTNMNLDENKILKLVLFALMNDEQ